MQTYKILALDELMQLPLTLFNTCTVIYLNLLEIRGRDLINTNLLNLEVRHIKF